MFEDFRITIIGNVNRMLIDYVNLMRQSLTRQALPFQTKDFHFDLFVYSIKLFSFFHIDIFENLLICSILIMQIGQMEIMLILLNTFKMQILIEIHIQY